ncbi:hypothetical protein V6N13_082051 [Hibiscus sabdariffa]
MKRSHPLPSMFDNTFTGRSARHVSTMILLQAYDYWQEAYDYWQHQPGSIPSRRLSRMLLNALPRKGRGHNGARASFMSRDKMHKLRATGPRPYAHEIFRIQKYDRASMHRRGRIMSTDTLGTPGTTAVH